MCGSGQGEMTKENHFRHFCKIPVRFRKHLLSPFSPHKRVMKSGSFGNCLDELSLVKGQCCKNIIFLFCLKKLIKECVEDRDEVIWLSEGGETLKVRWPGGGVQ